MNFDNYIIHHFVGMTFREVTLRLLMSQYLSVEQTLLLRANFRETILQTINYN